MSPFPGRMSPTPESSFQVHGVTVSLFIELDAFPTVQRTTHFLETTFPSMSPTHIKVEGKREEPGTSGQDGVQRTVPHMGNVAQLPLGKASGSEVQQAGPTPMDRFSCGESGLHLPRLL